MTAVSWHVVMSLDGFIDGFAAAIAVSAALSLAGAIAGVGPPRAGRRPRRPSGRSPLRPPRPHRQSTIRKEKPWLNARQSTPIRGPSGWDSTRPQLIEEHQRQLVC